ncbi:MAG: CNNM domain-containing protein [Evtepia sp.]
MDSTCIAIIVILVILIALSAWCSSTETAYSSVNKVRLKNKAEDGNLRAQKALDLLENYDKVLSCILIGNNIVNLTAATLGTVLFTKLLGEGYGPVASTIVLTVLVLIFGEIAPKTLANDQAEKFCIKAAPALKSLSHPADSPAPVFQSLPKSCDASLPLFGGGGHYGGRTYHYGRGGRKRGWVGAP